MDYSSEGNTVQARKYSWNPRGPVLRGESTVVYVPNKELLRLGIKRGRNKVWYQIVGRELRQLKR